MTVLTGTLNDFTRSTMDHYLVTLSLLSRGFHNKLMRSEHCHYHSFGHIITGDDILTEFSQ